jgi:hypothetical protein
MITDTNEVVNASATTNVSNDDVTILYSGLSESEKRRLVEFEMSKEDDGNRIALMTEFRDQMIATRQPEELKVIDRSIIEANKASQEEFLLTKNAKFEEDQREYAKFENNLVVLAAETLDPKDKLKKYVKLGREALKLASRRKASLKAGSWNGAGDFKKVCDDLGLLVKSKIAIKEVEFDKYVRMCLWVDAVKPLVPNVETLSWGQVWNKFLPTLEFDPVELTGEIKKGWIGFLGCVVAQQVSDEPMSIKELDIAIEAEKEKIKKEKENRAKALTPDEIEAKAAKAAESKKRAEKNTAMSKVSDSIDKGLETGQFTPAEVAEIAEKVVKTHNLEMPKSGFDAATCTMNDVLMIAKSLVTNGKFNEMRFLRDTLDKMIKINDNSLITTQAG